MNNNPCLLSPAERLKDWKKFRTSIFNSTNPERQVIDWWSLLPFINISIDIYNSKNWPNPWELVYYGEYCKSSISLGIAYTLILINKSWRNRIKILLIDDSLEIFLVVLIDDKYLLNYNYREIVNIKTLDSIKILETLLCDSSFNFYTKKEANETIL